MPVRATPTNGCRPLPAGHNCGEPVSEIPLTPNGKVDRRALPEPDATRSQVESSYIAPRTEIEIKLVEIWCEVLGIERIGIRDEFLELGGDSFKAIRITTRVNDYWGAAVPPYRLLLAGTIEAMAKVVKSALDENLQKPKR